jgi:hypothetical protein
MLYVALLDCCIVELLHRAFLLRIRWGPRSEQQSRKPKSTPGPLEASAIASFLRETLKEVARNTPKP